MRRIKYTLKAGKFICDHLEQGKSLTQICKNNDNVPSERTVYRWVRDIDGFREMYNTARQTQVYKWSDELMDLTELPLPINRDQMLAEKERRRLRMDALKFQIAKGVAAMRDKVIKIEHSGELQGPQIIIQSYSVPLVQGVTIDAVSSKLEHNEDD